MNRGFKDLKVWQKAYDFALEIYKVSKDFPVEEKYGLTSQARRAAVSVTANIAEGYERQHRKEYIQFLSVAKGSLGEVETYLLFLRDLNYIHAQQFLGLEEKRIEIAKMLRGVINSLS